MVLFCRLRLILALARLRYPTGSGDPRWIHAIRRAFEPHRRVIGSGHETRFPPPRLSAGCGFSLERRRSPECAATGETRRKPPLVPFEPRESQSRGGCPEIQAVSTGCGI